MAKAAQRNETSLERLSRRAREALEQQTASEPLVTPETEQHGLYANSTQPIDGRYQGVVVNVHSSTVRRWFSEEDRARAIALKDSTPFTELFHEDARKAIQHCEKLWAIIDGSESPLNGVGISGNVWIGQADQDARDTLRRYEEKFPHQLWWVFEDVVRHDEPAGVAGSHMANNKRSAIDAAKVSVAMVASFIAMWRG